LNLIEVFFLGIPRKAVYPMSSTAILNEAQQLHDVSDRLQLLAEVHPHVSEALLTISGNIRQTAAFLKVLVATRMALPGFDPAKS
jgi:hypothetical protein